MRMQRSFAAGTTFATKFPAGDMIRCLCITGWRASVTWKISIEGGNLSFSAAHFITLDGTYEPLHGHNYAVSAELAGTELTADSYLLDFGVVKSLLRGYISEVNHRFLLPLRNPFLRVVRQDDEWEIHLPDGARFIM